jgi:hypothetical protein
MDVGGFASVITAIAGTAGITTLLALLSRLSDLYRARRLVEAIEGTIKLVVEDRVATSALKLSLRVAVIQLAATSLIRVPLYRLVKQFGKLAGLALVLVVLGLLGIAGLRQLMGVDTTISVLSVWALSGSVAVGFFLAYRGALSEHRSAFVAEVLHRDDINLEVIRTYNTSLVHQVGVADQVQETRNPHSDT